MFSSRGTVRYEERGQGYRDVEKVGKHCTTLSELTVSYVRKLLIAELISLIYFLQLQYSSVDDKNCIFHRLLGSPLRYRMLWWALPYRPRPEPKGLIYSGTPYIGDSGCYTTNRSQGCVCSPSPHQYCRLHNKKMLICR